MTERSVVKAVEDCLRQWAQDVVQKIPSNGVFLFGSLVYKKGIQFDPLISDIDLLLGIPSDLTTAPERVEWIKQLVPLKRHLELQLLQLLNRPDAGSPISSIVAATATEICADIHKDGAARFFSGNEFRNLLDEVASARPVPNSGTAPVSDENVNSAMRFAQKYRNLFLSTSPNGTGGLQKWTGPDPVPKTVLRHAAMTAAAASGQCTPGVAFDVKIGLDYLTNHLYERRDRSQPYYRLHDWVSARRGGRGADENPAYLTPEMHLLLAEVIYDLGNEALGKNPAASTAPKGRRDERPTLLLSFIVNRPQYLSRIRDKFETPARTARRVVVTGIPGCGKSSIARLYEEECKTNGWATGWINSANIGTMDRTFRELASALNLAHERTLDSEEIRNAVFGELERRGPWMLVFDGAPDLSTLRRCFPHTANGRILITSNSHHWEPYAEPVHVSPGFNPTEAAEFLERRLPGSEPCSDNLAAFFLHHPLLLDFAVAYLRETGRNTTELIQKFLRSNRSLHEALKDSFGNFENRLGESPRLYFELLFKELPIPALEVLRRCAVLDPNLIPEEFLGTDEVRASLIRWRFIMSHDTPSPGGAVFQVHSVIHTAVRSILNDDDLRSAVDAAIPVLLQHFSFEWSKQETWATSSVFFSNALYVGKILFGLPNPPAAGDSFVLWTRVASYLGAIGRYREQALWLKEVLSWATQAELGEHPQMSLLFHQFAGSDRRLDCAAAGIAWQRKAVEYARRHSEATPPLVVALRCLGCHYLGAGDLDLAAESLREAGGILATMPAPRTSSETYRTGYQHFIQGLLTLQNGEYLSAREHLNEARSAFSNAGADTPLPLVEFFLGETARMSVAIDSPKGDGDYAEMEKHFHAALELFRQSSMPSTCIGDVPTIRRILGANLPPLPTAESAVPGANFYQARSCRVQGVPDISQKEVVLRSERLHAMKRHLNPEQRPATVVVTGPPGFGKSWLALSFANEAAREGRYDKIAWLNAETRADLTASVAHISRDWGVTQTRLIDGDLDSDRVGEGLWVRFREALSRSEGTRWLLVVDNIEDRGLLNDLVPSRPVGHVVITTTDRNLCTTADDWNVAPLDLSDGMDQNEAIALLTKTSLKDLGNAVDVARRLYCIPLLLVQAATYIREAHILTFGHYLRLLDQKALNPPFAPAVRYGRLFARTLDLTFEKAKEKEPEAIHLLQVLAALAPEAVPVDVLFPMCETEPQSIAERDACPTLRRQLNEAIMALQKWGLTRVTVGGVAGVEHRVLTTHRAILKHATERARGEDHNKFRVIAFALLERAFPQPEPWQELTPDEMDISRVLYPHWDHIGRDPLSTPDPRAAFALFVSVARYLRRAGDLNTAYEVAKEGFNKIADSPLADTLEAAMLADTLSTIIRSLEFDGAAVRERQLSEKALYIVQRKGGGDPLALARQLNHLGLSIGDYASTIGDIELKTQHYVESRNAIKKALDVLDGAKMEINSAELQGRWSQIRIDVLRNHGQALERLYKITPDHERLHKEALLKEALEHTEESLRLAELANNEAARGRAYHRLGSLHQKAGRLLEACEWMGKAWETNTKVYGPRHFQVAKDLRHRASILVGLSLERPDFESLSRACIDLREAEQIYHESVGEDSAGCRTIREQIAGLINQNRWMQPLREMTQLVAEDHSGRDVAI